MLDNGQSSEKEMFQRLALVFDVVKGDEFDFKQQIRSKIDDNNPYYQGMTSFDIDMCWYMLNKISEYKQMYEGRVSHGYI